MKKVGIIGGSGLDNPDILKDALESGETHSEDKTLLYYWECMVSDRIFFTLPSTEHKKDSCNHETSMIQLVYRENLINLCSKEFSLFRY